LDLDVDQFRCFWEQHFSDCPPVSYLFKQRLVDRWFRFHSLPESRRYPDNETEVVQLLTRQNTVLLDVIGTGECHLVAGHYSYSSPFEEQCSALSEFEFQEFLQLPQHNFEPDELELGEEPIHLELLFATYQLEYGSLDAVLRCVADWKIVNFFVVNCDRKRIFAPYDGGVDVILEDSKERDEFKAKYSDWLSSHPQGL
jgi:hypothetical protein